MMNKIAVALGLGVCAGTLALCCLSWGLWKLRHRMKTRQISATPEETSVENRKGLKKDMVLTLPTVNTRDTTSQCRICLLGFRDDDVVRQLPHCEHAFHRHCIDPVLGKRSTCPICSIRVTTDSSNPHLQPNPLRTVYSNGLSSPSSPREPSWILVNQPVPLPRTALVTSSSSSERFEIELNPSESVGKGESPLLKHSHVQEWKDDDLEKCIDISFTFSGDIPVEKRQQIYGLSSTNDKGGDSFSFSDAFTFPGFGLESSDAALRHSSRRKDSSSSSDFISSTRHSRSTSRSSRATNSSSDSSFKQSWDYGHPQEAFRYNSVDHLPLTRSPDQSSFEVLPVITGSGNQSLRPPREPMRVGSNRNSYSQL